MINGSLLEAFRSTPEQPFCLACPLNGALFFDDPGQAQRVVPCNEMKSSYGCSEC